MGHIGRSLRRCLAESDLIWSKLIAVTVLVAVVPAFILRSILGIEDIETDRLVRFALRAGGT